VKTFGADHHASNSGLPIVIADDVDGVRDAYSPRAAGGSQPNIVLVVPLATANLLVDGDARLCFS